MDFPKSVPNVGLVNGQYVDENTGTGQPGSLIPAVWGNAVTNEILNVLSAAQVVPDELKHNQLSEAISRIVAGNAYSKDETNELLGQRVASDGILAAGLINGSLQQPYFRSLAGGAIVPLARTDHSHSFADIKNKPTTLGGYGIQDVYTATYMDGLLNEKVGSNTITRAGLVDGDKQRPYFLSTAAPGLVLLALADHSHSFADLKNKPTTLGGYGIQDVYTATYMDGLLAQRVGADSITGAGFINGNQRAPYFRATASGDIVRLAASADTHTMDSFMKPVSGQWVLLNGSPPVLPPGGTWAYFKTDFNQNGTPYGGNAGVAAGGTTLSTSSYSVGFAWRIQ